MADASRCPTCTGESHARYIVPDDMLHCMTPPHVISRTSPAAPTLSLSSVAKAEISEFQLAVVVNQDVRALMSILDKRGRDRGPIM